MLVGDLVEAVAALVAAGGVYLIVGTLVGSLVGLGCSLLLVAAFLAYAAHVHGGVSLRSKDD